jgi:hypothetical protein
MEGWRRVGCKIDYIKKSRECSTAGPNQEDEESVSY